MVRDRSGVGWPSRLAAIAILAALYFGAYAAFFAPNLPPSVTAAVAETGDTVATTYIGWFPHTGRVFDTSLDAVARDNVTFPKAASFTYRDIPYAPLQFTLGCRGEEGVCPIVRFQEAVRGLRIGDTVRIEIPPEEAYGAADPDLIEVRTLTEEVVATETLTDTEFSARYGTDPVDGQIVVDPRWGWNVTVQVSGTTATIRHSPRIGEVVTVLDRWPARVVAIDDAADEGAGTIHVLHLLTEADVNAFLAEDDGGEFVIVALDLALGTYTVDYNREVVGKTLAFEITLVAISKGR